MQPQLFLAAVKCHCRTRHLRSRRRESVSRQRTVMSRPRTFMCASQTFATRSPSSPRRAHAPDESLVTLAKRLDVPEGVATAGFTLPEPFASEYVGGWSSICGVPHHARRLAARRLPEQFWAAVQRDAHAGRFEPIPTSRRHLSAALLFGPGRIRCDLEIKSPIRRRYRCISVQVGAASTLQSAPSAFVRDAPRCTALPRARTHTVHTP